MSELKLKLWQNVFVLIKKMNDFQKKRKEMYKHKNKLKSNIVELGEDTIIYK